MTLATYHGYGDGAWCTDSGQRVLLERAGYTPSLYLARWWVSPAVALIERRLGSLPIASDARRYFPEMATIQAENSRPRHPQLWEAAPGGQRVRALTRWDAVVALLALEIERTPRVRPDDVELVACAALLYATGRVGPL